MVRETVLKQQSILSSIFFHLFTGILVLTFQFITVNLFINRGYPHYISGLVGFICISIPIQLLIIRNTLKSSESLSIFDLVGRPIKKSYKIIIPMIFAFYVLAVILTPLNSWMRREIFYWMPEWSLEPFIPESILRNRLFPAFILTFLIDGLLNPIVEELYWRGYLLKRISRFGLGAPMLNGFLFGIQHFWQPFNYLSIIPYSILLSYIVWKKGDLRLSIIIHCTINCLGALLTYIPLLIV